MPSNEFSTRLKQAMSEAGMNQADVIHSAAQHDKKLGKSQVSQYVSGKTTPRRDVMELLARILDVDAAWLSGNTQTRSAQTHSPTRAPERLETASSTKLNQNDSTTTGQTPVCETPAPEQTPRSATMREFKKSSKLDNVLYDVRGPVVDEAARLEKEGQRILKLHSVSAPPMRLFKTCATSCLNAKAIPILAAYFRHARQSCSMPSSSTFPTSTWTVFTPATA